MQKRANGVCRIRCNRCSLPRWANLAGSSLKATLRVYELEGEQYCNFDLDQRRRGVLRKACLLTINVARIWYAQLRARVLCLDSTLDNHCEASDPSTTLVTNQLQLSPRDPWTAGYATVREQLSMGGAGDGIGKAW
jgi:hypothetical protein